MERIANLKQNVGEWSERLAHQLNLADVLLDDSASNVGQNQGSRPRRMSQHLKVGSNVSNTSLSSSIFLSKAKATAKRAKLEAQAATFRKKRALQEEQFRLESLPKELDTLR